MKSIIMAAGKGTRMKSDLPKVVHLAHGKPMIVRIIDALNALDVEENILVLGHKKEKVLRELKTMIDILEKYYEKTVIIYVDYKAYKNFIENELVDNPLWIRNVKYYPNISEKDRWIIWQYSNRGRVYGIDGFTDKNVLRYDKMINEL